MESTVHVFDTCLPGTMCGQVFFVCAMVQTVHLICVIASDVEVKKKVADVLLAIR